MATQEKTWNVANRLHSQKDSDNPEVNHIIAGADEIYDDAKGAKQSDINAQTDAALANRYEKSETYSKEQLNSLITTPDANYVSVVATNATTVVTDVLPATGEANTIYRVGNWNGTQYDPTMYALYAWNGTAYVCLAVRSFVGDVYDISANHPDGQGNPTPYTDLTAALGTDGANIPADIRRGGMRIKFIQGNAQSSDNKYVHFRLMAQTFTIDTTKWQGVDVDYPRVYEKPTDIVSSGALFNELWPVKKVWNGMYIKGTPYGSVPKINIRDNYQSLVIPLKGDEIVFIMNGTNASGYTCVKSFNYPDFELAEWTVPPATYISLGANEQVFLNLADGEHNNTKYLLIVTKINGSNRTPSTIMINGQDIFDGTVSDDADFAHNKISTSLAVSKAVRNVLPSYAIQHIHAYMAENTYPFLKTDNNNYDSLIIPLDGTETSIKIIGNKTNATNYTVLDKLVFPYYVLHSGFNRTIGLPTNGSEVDITKDGQGNPIDMTEAKYLVVSCKVGTDRTPLSIKINDHQLLDYDIRDEIASKLPTERFENIVGDGITEDLEFVYYAKNVYEEFRGMTVCKYLKAGEKIIYDLVFGSSGRALIISATKVFVTGFYTIEDKPDLVVQEVWAEAGPKRHIQGVFVAEQDCYVKLNGFIANETHPYDQSIARVYKTISEVLKEDVSSRGLLKYFNLGTPQTLFRADLHELFSSFNSLSVLTVENGLYYMYNGSAYKEEATIGGKPVLTPQNDDIGFNMMWSNDGINWNWKYPTGIEPVDLDYQDIPLMFRVGRNYIYSLYETTGESAGNKKWCVEVKEQKQRQRSFNAFDVRMVNDPVNPFRVIGNKEIVYNLFEMPEGTSKETIDAAIQGIITGFGNFPKDLNAAIQSEFGGEIGHYYLMYMFKSADGIHWGDFDTDGIEISELSYDTQYSIIPCGNVMRVYERGWDYTKQKPQRRNVAVMTIDLEGNIMSSSTCLFGDGLYTSAASKIDDRREILFPTLWTEIVDGRTDGIDNDKAEFLSYIVDGDKVYHSSDINDILKGIDREHDTPEDIDKKEHYWGVVSPGLILKDGDIYIIYFVHAATHGDGTHPRTIYSPYFVNVNIVQLSWIRDGSASTELTKPREI